jgi:hypothetical protein
MTKVFELMMCGIATCHRGLGYGSSILDSVITITSREYFHLIVRYPVDQQLLLVMLITRGFASAGRVCADRAGFLLVVTKSRWYASRDALMSYGPPAANESETEGRGTTSADGEAFH